MKKILLLLLFVPMMAAASTPARFDLPVITTTPDQVPVGSLPNLLAVTNATISVCGYPATLSNGVCTNTITTYTDSTLTTACPSTAQLTVNGTSVCVPTSGLQGSFGFWYNSATQTHMTYTVQTTWGTFGPYDILQGAGGGGSGSVTGFSSGNLAPLFTTGVTNGSTTPAQTFTASTFAPHTFYGNNGLSTGTPGANLIGASDWGPNSYAAGSGSAQVQTITLTPAVTALAPNLTVCWLPIAANTATAPTLNVNGLGARVITKYGTSGLIASDLTTTAIACAKYDGTVWQLQNPQTVTGGGGSSFITSLTTTGTSGPAAVTGGVLNIPQYSGGGSLPTATAAGQMLSSTAAGTTYAVQGQIFYAQSGDTIASIESECSSLCTYVVTTSQTITLAANHTLNANVVLRMEAGGAWTVNGTGFTLSGVQVAPGSTLTQHFVAGTGSVALSAKNTLVPVEWFGAVGDWNGTTGTDNTTAIQNTLNAIVGGQALLQCRGYKTTAALTISASSIGMAGLCYGYPATGAGVPSYLISTSASADVIDVAGTSPSASLTWNKFNDFAIERSVVPTGTATGLSLNYVGGYTIDRVAVNDSVRGFYLHSTPAYGFGIISNSEAAWGAAGVTETSGSYYGFYLDSADGNAENSLRMLHDNAETNSLPGITSYGIYMYGSAINDVMVDGFETALVTYGKWVQFTSGGTTYAAGDIHFWNCIDDGFYASAYYITNVTAAKDGTIDIAGARISSGNTTTGNGGIDIENSSGVTISHSQIGAGNIVNGIFASGSSSLTITGNTFQDLITTDIDLYNTNASAVTGNTFWGSSTKVPYIMVKLDGTASYNTVSGNSFSGYDSSYAIFANTSTTNNALIAGNAIDTTHMTNGGIGDAGTNNNLVAIAGPGMAISGSTLAVTPLTITNSHTSGVNINFSNTSTGGKSWYLLSQGSGAGLGLSAGETAFYDATDSTLTFSMTNARVKSWLPLYVGSSSQFQVDASGNTSVTNPTAATSGANANSPNMTFTGHAWNGAASVSSAWNCYDNLASWSGSPSNVQPFLECDYTGYSSGQPSFHVPALNTGGINTVGGLSSADWIIFNSNPATSGANYNSNNLGFHAAYWTGAVTNADQWNIGDVLGTGANPTNTLTFTHYSGSTGFSSASFGALPVTVGSVLAGVLYSAAGTALPTCASGIKGERAVVSDATAPTYMGAYTSGGGITAETICSYNGTTYGWLMH